MATIDLTDDELVNLQWLLQAIGADGGIGVRIMTFASGPWANGLWLKLAGASTQGRATPLRTLDQLRSALGAYAATADTQQQTDDLRAASAAYSAQIAAMVARIDASGVASGDADPIRRLEALVAAVTPKGG